MSFDKITSRFYMETEKDKKREVEKDKQKVITIKRATTRTAIIKNDFKPK